MSKKWAFEVGLAQVYTTSGSPIFRWSNSQSWMTLSMSLPQFCSGCVGQEYEFISYMMVYATCCLRRIWFTDPSVRSAGQGGGSCHFMARPNLVYSRWRNKSTANPQTVRSGLSGAHLGPNPTGPALTGGGFDSFDRMGPGRHPKGTVMWLNDVTAFVETGGRRACHRASNIKRFL